MNQAGGSVDLASLPDWAFWVIACAALVVFAASVLRVLSPPVRRGKGGRSVAVGAALFLLWSGISRDPRSVLWIGSVGFVMAALPLFWMGRLPADMPDARDPTARQHPRYVEVERRGRIAGCAMIALLITGIVLSEIFFRGV